MINLGEKEESTSFLLGIRYLGSEVRESYRERFFGICIFFFLRYFIDMNYKSNFLFFVFLKCRFM